MDPFTQRLMDRARVRRENLEKKLTDQNTPRKRPMPLGDHNEQVIDTTSSSQDDDDSDGPVMQDSPKRQCVRSTEQHIKADTPAIQGVQSRRDALANPRTFGVENVEDDYVPPLRRRHDALLDAPNTVPVPVAPSRRNRLAALASTINNWEDDLSQPRIKPPEEKKRGWQPPKAPESENKAESESKRNRFSKVDDGPSKPPRTYEYESSSRERSPEKAARSSPKKTVVSSLTVGIGGGSPKPAQIQVVAGSTTDVSPTVSKNIGFVPGTTTAVSPSVKTLGSSSSSTSSSNLNRSPKPFRRNDPTRGSGSPVRSVAAPKPVNARDESSKPASLMAAWKSKDKANSRRDSDVNEPTKQPVAARMGLWETKINEAEKLKKPVSPIKAGTGNAPKAPRPKSAVVMRQKTAAEPTDESVHNRMSLWEKRVVDSKKDTSPTRAPRPLSADIKAGITQKASEMQGRRTSPRKAPSSAVMSPEKVGPATKTLADRLAEMEQGWQRNEIAAKIKADKDKDMAMLQNRWKNGMPSEGTGETEAPNAQVSAPPPAPPAPPLLATPKSPAKDSPVSSKREVHRQKVRGDFENKLRAMGFDVHGSTDTGNVAVADLTPHKDRERDEKKNGNTPKKANIQLKVVEVEDSRTTSTTFGETEVSMKNAEGPGTHVSSVTTTLSTGSQPQTNKTSIYQLIKNKGAQPSTPLARPVSQPRQDDSFDSGDSYDEADESYSDQESEIYGSKPVHQGVRHAVSQQSVYSASSETSERTDYTETETEYTEDNSEDEDYTDEESEEDEEGDGKVDDLLDEVMDDTITTDSEPAPVPKPRQYAVQTDQRRQEPRSSRDDENFRVPRVQVPMRRKDNRVTFSDSVAGGSTSSQTATSSSAGSSSSSSASESESDAERPVVYSIDMYRRSNSHRNDDSIPKMTIVRHSENTKRASAIEEPLPYIPEKPVRQRLQELQDMVNQEQSVVQQTSNALNQCCGANSNFANSIEAVECHRLLLIACKKREGYLTEMERLRSNRGAKSAGPSGSLSISDIRIPLKKDFTQKIGTLADVSQHFFVCLLRNGSNTIVSQMVSTHDAMVRDTLDIPNMFKISDIKQDFKTELEIYSMSINREQTISTPKKKQKAQTPKKGLFGSLKPSTPRSMQSPGGPMVVRTTNFSQIASLPITLRSVNKSHFSLDRVPYASPLQGTIHIRLQCIMESAVEEKGFLTMFEDVGGFGAWHRRWCVLKNNVLSYWKYPDDENIKVCASHRWRRDSVLKPEPMGYVDLKMCITERVGLIPRDICARPHTFELVCVRRQHKGDSNTLITRCNNTMTSTRHQLSADTKEDRLIWCDALNKALTNLRMWNTDALRPVKMQ